MSNIGVFFTLTLIELATLTSQSEPSTQRTWADSAFTDRSLHAPSRMLNIDVSWDSIHRCLGNGFLDEDPTQFPLRRVILGGQKLNADPNFILRLNAPDKVQEIALSLAQIDEDDFRKCYFAIPAESYLMTPNEPDFQYTWTYFQQVQIFYNRAAEQGEYVLFTADQ